MVGHRLFLAQKTCYRSQLLLRTDANFDLGAKGFRQVTGFISPTKPVTSVGHRFFFAQKTCDRGRSQVVLRSANL